MGQRTHITMGQCWSNAMHPTQLSHVKTSHGCTLAQRWANVLIPTSYRSDCQWQNVNVGTMLGQRCTSNPNHRPTVLPYANVGPTLPVSLAIWDVAKSYSRLRLICSVLRASKFSVLKLAEIVMLWVYYTIPFGFSLFWHFWEFFF